MRRTPGDRQTISGMRSQVDSSPRTALHDTDCDASSDFDPQGGHPRDTLSAEASNCPEVGRSDFLSVGSGDSFDSMIEKLTVIDPCGIVVGRSVFGDLCNGSF